MRLRFLLVLLGSLLFPVASFAATATWTGATSGQWSVGTNWSGNTPPVPGDDLVFPNDAHAADMINDLPAGTFFQSLTFTVREHYTISGNAMSIGSGGLTAPTDVVGFDFFRAHFDAPVTLTQPQTWSATAVEVASLNLAAGPATLQCGTVSIVGSVSGSGGIACNDPGTQASLLFHDMTYTGPTVVGGANRVTIATDGDVLTPITVNAGGVLNLLADHPSVQAPLAIHSDGTYTSYLNDKIVTTAQVTLGGNLTVYGPFSILPAPGTEYTLIENQSGLPIAGTFAGYPEGSLVPVGSAGQVQVYRISYLGGASGHDVTLTAQSGPTVTVSASPMTATYGTLVTLAATTSPAASGTVTFWTTQFSSPYSLGTVLLDNTGQAVLNTTALGFGISGDIYAVYNGSETQSASRSATIHLTITPPGTSFALSAEPVALVPDAVVLHAVLITEPLVIPQGTISFYEGATLVGSAPLHTFFVTEIAWGSECAITVTGLAPGKHVFTAVWTPPEPAPQKQSGTAEFLVPGATITTLTVSPSTANQGQPVTITAHVAAGATGSVLFGGGIGVRVPLNANGDAVLTTSTLPPGTYNVVATYSGDPLHSGSRSAVAPVTIVANQTGAEVPTLGEVGLAALGALLAMLAMFKLRG